MQFPMTATAAIPQRSSAGIRLGDFKETELAWLSSIFERLGEEKGIPSPVHVETLARLYNAVVQFGDALSLENIFVSYRTLAMRINRTPRWVGEGIRHLVKIGVLSLVRKGNSFEHLPHSYRVSRVFQRQFWSWILRMVPERAKRAKKILAQLQTLPLAESTMKAWRMRNPFRSHTPPPAKADPKPPPEPPRKWEPPTPPSLGGVGRNRGGEEQKASPSHLSQPRNSTDSAPSGTESRQKPSVLADLAAMFDPRRR